jgi:ABC-type transport system substrate-binding protein
MMKKSFYGLMVFGLLIGLAVAVGCGGEEPVVQVERVVETVIVEKSVTQIEKVVETVVVEKVIEGKTVKVVETVIVDRPVTTVQKVIETVIVDRPVTRIEKVVETVVVTEVEVVVATAMPIAMSADGSDRISPSGHFVVAENLVVPPILLPALAGGGLEFSYYNWGVVDYPLSINAADEPDPAVSIWDSWTVSQDGLKVSWTVRPGVQFHQGWGEVTAEDIAFSFNNANREGSRFYGLTSLVWFDRMEALDDRSGVMYLLKDNPLWILQISNASTHNVWIVSKKLFDERGEEGGADTAIGTGPYQVRAWATSDRVLLEATEEHYRVVPLSKTFEVIEISEPLAKQAAFLTGEVDILQMDNSLIKDTFAKLPGSTTERIGEVDTQMIHFTGNYWLKGPLPHRTDPDAAFPRQGYTLDDEHPWIGDIDDPASMERARKIRVAMSMAIDQETILKEVFDGFGIPYATQQGFKPGDPGWNDDWVPPAYDPEGAKALLAEAGFPNGFEFEAFFPAGVTTISDEAAFAAAQMWREVGLEPVIDNGTYASGRDRRFDGVDNIIRMHHIFTGKIDQEKCQGLGAIQAYYGSEIPREYLDICARNKTEPNRATRIANNAEVQDYLSYWRLFLPLSAKSTNYMVGPNVLTWEPHVNTQPFFIAPWTVSVKQ